MQQANITNTKDCLRNRYNCANLPTQIALEINRLEFLKKCLMFKRAPQSLRVKGLNGLLEERGRLLIQEIETKAVLTAIKGKERMIVELKKLKQENMEVDDAVDVGLVAVNKKKLEKKIMFFEDCEQTKWRGWKKKVVQPNFEDTKGKASIRKAK